MKFLISEKQFSIVNGLNAFDPTQNGLEVERVGNLLLTHHCWLKTHINDQNTSLHLSVNV